MIRDIRIIIIASIISFALSFFYLSKTPQKIVVIDQEKIARNLITNIATSLESNDEKIIRNKTTFYATKIKELKARISQIAQEKNLIVLDKSIILGGGEDQTQYAQKILQQIIDEEDQNNSNAGVK